jgi:DMSO/TMAO reductase YedYZ heme-binding membrane subunit
LGDITGFILLITSNNLSMMLLKKNWKRIQKLAYVYFYAGGIYEAYALGNAFALISMIVVSITLALAFILKMRRKQKQVLAQ